MSDLDKQLRSLVERYGLDEVRRYLKAIAGQKSLPKKKRIGALEYVSKMSLPVTHKKRLLTIAGLFKEHRFLPTTSDARNLFEAFGAVPPAFKGREAAVPAIFRFLASLSEGQLDRILSDGAFDGPSQLGPIADAITARSATTTSHSAVGQSQVTDHAEGPDKTKANR